MFKIIALALSAVVLLFANTAIAEPREDRLREILPEIQTAIMQQDLVRTLRTYNKNRGDMTQADIGGLEAIWQAERTAGNQPLTTGVVQNIVALRMRKVIRDTGKVVTAINVIDARGLSIAQTTAFPCIWQGQKTQIVDVSNDASPEISIRERESEIQLAITDPDTGERIGTVIILIDADTL